MSRRSAIKHRRQNGNGNQNRPAVSIVKSQGCVGLYRKLCKHYGEEEVGMVKSLMAPNFSDMEFVQALYMAKINGVNPLKKQCYFYMAKNRETGERTLVFVVAIDAFRARAMKRGLLEMKARAVCEGDQYEWNADEGRPNRHVYGLQKRGKVLRGWGRIKVKGMETAIALEKDADEWLDGADSWFHKTMAAHAMEITIERQMYRIVVPDVLSGAHVPEEFGGRVIGGELSMDPKMEAGPPKEDRPAALTMEGRERLWGDLRVFFDKLGIDRNKSRWAQMGRIVGKDFSHYDKGRLMDWDLIEIHSTLETELHGNDKATDVEVVRPELIKPDGDPDPDPKAPKGGAPTVETTENKTEKEDDAPSLKPEHPCEDCGQEVPEDWRDTLKKFKATKQQCAPCYYNLETEARKEAEES